MKHEAQVNLYSVYRGRFPRLSKTLLSTPAGDRYTYADAEEHSAQIANALVAMGLQRGDRVSVQVEKSPQVLWLYLGVIRAGMVFHPLNTAYTDEELRFFLADAGTSLLVCDSSRARVLQGVCHTLGVPHLLTLDADGGGTLAQVVRSRATQFDTAATSASEVAALVYSSGTTGRPKGIMLSHANLVENITVLVELWGFHREDCLLHALPVFHVHGLFVAIGCVLMSGASMRWLPGFSVETVKSNLPASTVMMGVPTYYTRLLADSGFSAETCRAMRLFISGSAPLLADTFEEFEQRSGHTILERYGMTETGMNTSNPLQGQRRAGTVGMPLPGVSVRICDANHAELERGEVGDLQVKGPNVFIGYWNMPEKTVEDFTADGYFITGDQALIDAEGYVSIVGRTKDMVISGGLNVYPKEVELIIDAIPGVLESAVIGLPDADFGEIVVAIVVLEEEGVLTEQQIREISGSYAASFKVPKKVHFALELPRNAMGKVQKGVLRKQYGVH